MQAAIVGKWVEVTLVNGKSWVGYLEEWDDEALFVTNGITFGKSDHKGAECTADEVSKVVETSQREFQVS